jgi:choline-glycine betaine transporter
MENRTAAVIITILAILFCGCPGLAFLCFGVTDFIDYYAFNSYIYGISDQTASNIGGIAGICAGILFIAIAVVISVLVLRRKKVVPPSTNEPLPPPV